MSRELDRYLLANVEFALDPFKFAKALESLLDISGNALESLLHISGKVLHINGQKGLLHTSH